MKPGIKGAAVAAGIGAGAGVLSSVAQRIDVLKQHPILLAGLLLIGGVAVRRKHETTGTALLAIGGYETYNAIADSMMQPTPAPAAAGLRSRSRTVGITSRAFAAAQPPQASLKPNVDAGRLFAPATEDAGRLYASDGGARVAARSESAKTTYLP
jgi:hypothetical protein